MIREIAVDWATELRSGKYKQGEGCLRDSDNRYCCLGVLSEMAVKAGVIPAPVYQGSFVGTWKYEGDASLIPSTVRLWAGMKDDAGEFTDNSGETYILAALNDSGTMSFDQLADMIMYFSDVI